jgi:predicted metal-dependent phosphoesterase TrpH
MIDLHIHTDASDGTLSPSEVVRLAARAGLQAIAITDHESMAGTPAFLEECRRQGIEGISGIEIGVRHAPGTMHILGYFVDPFAEGLQALTTRVRAGRVTRIEGVVGRLRERGLGVSTEDVIEEAKGAPMGRPHVARLLVRRGFVSSIQEAFTRYLGKGGLAYMEREKPDFEEVRSAIEEAGGIMVLAHPITLGMFPDGLRSLLEDLSSRGLSGLEVYYPTQQGAVRDLLLEMARDLSLAVTGGSDFHGDVKPEWKMGVGEGDLSVPYTALEELKEKLSFMMGKRREAIGGERSDR